MQLHFVNVPFMLQNCDAGMTAQKNDELCKTVKCIPEDDRKVTLSNQSNQANGFIRKEENGKAPLGNAVQISLFFLFSNLFFLPSV